MEIKIKILTLLVLSQLLLASAKAQTWQWVAQAGGTENDYASALEVDNSGNSYVTGKF